MRVMNYFSLYLFWIKYIQHIIIWFDSTVSLGCIQKKCRIPDRGFYTVDI